MSLLDRITSPADVRGLTRDELDQLADDVRARLIDVCSRTGGHIGAGLGVVELTIALHYAFETPRDQVVWDVGHQGIHTKSSPGGTRAWRRCARKPASPVSSSEPRASTTRSAPATPRHRFLRPSASPPDATCRARTSRSSP